MTFLHPQLLWLLLVPAALLLAACLPRTRSAATLPLPKIPRAVLGPSSFELRASPLAPRPLAACVALAALVLTLARPQGATISMPAITQARDVLVAVDVSRSMLADDVAPDRLSRARLLVRSLADELKGERLGLLPFAGTAFLQSPLSADYEIFRTFLDELGPDMIPSGGSDFTALLTTADEAFGPADSSSPDAPPHADRYLVILSDGEAEDDTWKPLAQKLSTRGVRILALGLGTTAGAMIPDGKGGLVKDPRGAAVLSRLDSSTLQELARVTDGAYRDASAWVDLPALLRATISRGRVGQTTTDTAPRREELFAWFLAPALALLLLSLVREFPATPRPRHAPATPPKLPPRLPPPLPGRHAAALLLLLALPAAFIASPSTFAAEPAPEAPPDPLLELVGRLAAAAEPAPSELAHLAALTADQAEKARATPDSSFPESAIQDALAATELGRATDPTAADWSALRSRLQALLAPPPEPPKPDQSQQNQSDSKKGDKNDAKNSPQSESASENDQNNSPEDDAKNDAKKDPSSSDQSQEQQDQKSSGQNSPQDAQDQKSTASKSDSDSQSSGQPGSQASDSASQKPSGSPGEALGDLAQKTDEKSAAPSGEKSDDKKSDESVDTAASENPTDQPPEPTQRAGGVSTSGQDAEGGDSALTRIDPALVVPHQRLERVRDADAPARLYQLIQEAETPPDSARRAPGAPTRDW